MIRSCLFITSLLPLTIKAQHVELRGVITYQTGNYGEHYFEQRQFFILKNSDKWLIRTTSSNVSASSQIPLYDEAGFDGTNVYYLTRYHIADTAERGGEVIPAVGRVHASKFPPCLEPSLIYPLWLAYCSSEFFDSLNSDEVVAPLFVPESSQVGPVPSPFALPTDWETNGSRFPSKILWFSKGYYPEYDADGGYQLLKYPKPFDKGFCLAAYKTLEWTNYGEWTLPAKFSIQVFPPNSGESPSNSVAPSYSLLAQLASIQESDKADIQPKIETISVITDSRIKVKGKPVSYRSLTNWESISTIEARLANGNYRLNSSEFKSHWRRTLILLMLGAPTILGLGFLVSKKLKKRQGSASV